MTPLVLTTREGPAAVLTLNRAGRHHCTFLIPAHPGQELQADVAISRIRAGKQLINLHTTCRTGEGDPICLGEALVEVSDVKG